MASKSSRKSSAPASDEAPISGGGEPAPVESRETVVQAPPPEWRYAEEIAALIAGEQGPRPPGWRMAPAAVVRFICGGEVRLNGGESLQISAKFVGERALVERAVVTLAGQRGLLLVGEPGTAKSMLSELLAAAISGSSGLTVQGTAGTTEDQLRYGWNYAALLAQGPGEQALVPSPIFQAMRRGAIARVEEITRCLPEVQDALVSILSDRRLAVPELGEEGVVHARPGFNVIATANLRDRGVSEMSAALKRRFNFENVPPIAALEQEVALVSAQVRSAIARVSPELPVDLAVLQALVTSFRDLRSGRTEEGWAVERPASVLSTAEAVAAGTSLCLQAAWFTERGAAAGLLPEHLLGVVLKDEPKDRARLVSYFDGPVKRRAEKDPLWKEVFGARRVLDGL
jgi:MoxR-like ATPase